MPINCSFPLLRRLLSMGMVFIQTSNLVITAKSLLPYQNLAKSHHLSSGVESSKPHKYINTDIWEQNIYNHD